MRTPKAPPVRVMSLEGRKKGKGGKEASKF
jgi:hypothetical protein